MFFLVFFVASLSASRLHAAIAMRLRLDRNSFYLISHFHFLFVLFHLFCLFCFAFVVIFGVSAVTVSRTPIDWGTRTEVGSE